MLGVFNARNSRVNKIIEKDKAEVSRVMEGYRSMLKIKTGQIIRKILEGYENSIQPHFSLKIIALIIS